MKFIKAIISIVVIFALLAMLLSVSGSSRVLLDKLNGISQGQDESPDNSDFEELGTEDGGGASGDSGNGSTDGSSDNIGDGTLEVSGDVTEPRPIVNLVWSEDFSDVSLVNTKDEDGYVVQYTDNYLVYFADTKFLEPICIGEFFGEDQLSVYLTGSDINIGDKEVGGDNFEDKPVLKLATGFTEEFYKENLLISENKYIAMKFDMKFDTSLTSLYLRYRTVRVDGVDNTDESNSLKVSDKKFADLYEFGDEEDFCIVAFINVTENITESDLYFYISNLDQIVVFEDFLGAGSSYIESFEILFDEDPQENTTSCYFDNFELYTFGSAYEGSVQDALEEINFIN